MLSRKVLFGSSLSSIDPNFDDVSLLLHMDGSDGSTTFTDSSGNAYAITANGNAQIDTAQSKFGGAAGLFDGAGDYLGINDDDSLSLQSSGWTVEAWVRFASLAAGEFYPIFSKGQGSYSREYVFDVRNDAGTIEARAGVYADGSFYSNAARTISVSVDTWYHIAWSHDGTNVRIFIDGVQQGSAGSLSAAPGNRTEPAFVGRHRVPGVLDRYFDGHIDDFRFTNGVARYTSSFTPPTDPFPDS